MDMITVFRVPLNEEIFKSFLYYINQDHIEQYIVNKTEALKSFSPFLSEEEKKVMETEKWIQYVVFYVDKSV